MHLNDIQRQLIKQQYQSIKMIPSEASKKSKPRQQGIVSPRKKLSEKKAEVRQMEKPEEKSLPLSSQDIRKQESQKHGSLSNKILNFDNSKLELQKDPKDQSLISESLIDDQPSFEQVKKMIKQEAYKGQSEHTQKHLGLLFKRLEELRQHKIQNLAGFNEFITSERQVINVICGMVKNEKKEEIRKLYAHYQAQFQKRFDTKNTKVISNLQKRLLQSQKLNKALTIKIEESKNEIDVYKLEAEGYKLNIKKQQEEVAKVKQQAKKKFQQVQSKLEKSNENNIVLEKQIERIRKEKMISLSQIKQSIRNEMIAFLQAQNKSEQKYQKLNKDREEK